MRSALLPTLLKNVLFVVLGLLLFGLVGKGLAWLTILFWIVWRLQALLIEGHMPVMRDEDWKLREQNILSMVDTVHRDELALGKDQEATSEDWVEIARNQIAEERAAWQAPRSLSIRLAEALGSVGYLILLPLALELWQSDLFSMRRSYGIFEAVIFAGCATLFALPHLRLFRSWHAIWFWIWWFVPFLASALFVVYMIQVAHPYLNPLNPDRARLAAEKVLSHTAFIEAADHADWVVHYAKLVADAGETEKAKDFCQSALRLQPTLNDAVILLEALNGKSLDEVLPADFFAPYTLTDSSIPPMPFRTIEDAVHGAPNCTVILLPVGSVHTDLLNYVAFVLQRETDLPAVVYPKSLPLPEATRKRGLAVDQQWDILSVYQVMAKETEGRRIRGPVIFVVITNADLYAGDANFVFGSSYDGACIVSIARLGTDGNDALLRHRAVKLCLGSLIKTFRVPPSGDWRCVTSYTRSLAEFDSKGHRPLPETLRRLQEAVAEKNRAWPPKS